MYCGPYAQSLMLSATWHAHCRRWMCNHQYVSSSTERPPMSACPAYYVAVVIVPAPVHGESTGSQAHNMHASDMSLRRLTAHVGTATCSPCRRAAKICPSFGRRRNWPSLPARRLRASCTRRRTCEHLQPHCPLHAHNNHLPGLQLWARCRTFIASHHQIPFTGHAACAA